MYTSYHMKLGRTVESFFFSYLNFLCLFLLPHLKEPKIMFVEGVRGIRMLGGGLGDA